MAIDIGGATTDVLSISQELLLLKCYDKGLPRTLLIRRTVEGDLGMRYVSHLLLLKQT